jgi:hypothetical protein
MGTKEQLEEDVQDFLENMNKLLPDTRAKVLMTLVDKYIHLSTAPVALGKADFEMVKDHAHRFYISSSFPKFLGSAKREIDGSEANILAIIEGTITMLNSNECLKKLPKFDYR